ncbi:hypothetical protein D3C78_1756260 [compost metagenome]
MLGKLPYGTINMANPQGKYIALPKSLFPSDVANAAALSSIVLHFGYAAFQDKRFDFATLGTQATLLSVDTKLGNIDAKSNTNKPFYDATK